MADLAKIDATLSGLCACGCGRKLEANGPSGWWATEACQQAGTRALTGATAWPMNLGCATPELSLICGEAYYYRYFDLSDDQRQALHDWVDAHGVDHTHVPVDAVIVINCDEGRVSIEVYDWTMGHPVLDDTGQTVRRFHTSAIRAPWPLPGPGGRRG